MKISVCLLCVWLCVAVAAAAIAALERGAANAPGDGAKAVSSAAGNTVTLARLSGAQMAVSDVERAITGIMEKAGVPGLSCAIINDGRIVYAKGFGVRETGKAEPVNEQTVFAAASFSKTVFAYLVLRLVDDGVVDLDKPLHEYLAKLLPEYPAYADLAGDARYKRITARIVLSHTTGFPNWRVFTDDGGLRIYSNPGKRFGYSGEGIDLLQLVVEEITGEGLEALAHRYVFEPLGMKHTSYVWQDRFEANLAIPHDAYERPKRFRRRMVADAAGSMATTAHDYARLLVAVLDAGGLGKTTLQEMLRPQISIRSSRMFGPGAGTDTEDRGDVELSWGLGWGRFDCVQGRAMFHTGHESGTQNYNVTFIDRGIGVVFLSNSDNFESVARELVEVTIGDTYSPFDWLGYAHYDPNRPRVPPPEPAAVEVAPGVLEGYVGTYQLGAGTFIHVKLENGVLLASSDNAEWAELRAETETRFFVKGETIRIEFVTLGTGIVPELVLEIEEGVTLHAARIDETH